MIVVSLSSKFLSSGSTMVSEMRICQKDTNSVCSSSTPMSDATITPPCSPPCGAQEVEEGELLDETQELLDMSDIRY